MFTQYNPAGGIIPNHPIVHSIVNMERQIAELYGQLEAAGCTVTENHGELCVSVPTGVDIMPIMEKHREMFTKG